MVPVFVFEGAQTDCPAERCSSKKSKVLASNADGLWFAFVSLFDTWFPISWDFAVSGTYVALARKPSFQIPEPDTKAATRRQALPRPQRFLLDTTCIGQARVLRENCKALNSEQCWLQACWLRASVVRPVDPSFPSWWDAAAPCRRTSPCRGTSAFATLDIPALPRTFATAQCGSLAEIQCACVADAPLVADAEPLSWVSATMPVRLETYAPQVPQGVAASKPKALRVICCVGTNIVPRVNVATHAPQDVTDVGQARARSLEERRVAVRV